MARAKAVEEELELEEYESLPVDFDESLTIAIEKEPEKPKGIRVPVFLPRLEDPGDGGMRVDQYEHVTIANERGETCYKVLRGERVEVPISVFMVLKEKYPKL